MRLSKPFTRVVKPLTACFVGSRSKTEPSLQPRNQASKSPTPQPAAAETILVPESSGPITSSNQPMQGIVSVDCFASTGTLAYDNNWVLGTLTSEVADASQPVSSNSLETALAAAQLLHSPSLASPHPHPMSADMSSPVHPDSATLSANMPDSPDYQALLAEVLVRVFEYVSQDGQCQPADHAVTCSEQTEQPPGVDSNLTTSAAAQLDIMADTCEPLVDVYEINSGCSKSADAVAGSINDAVTALVDALASSEVQHAAVDQVVDDLLTEVSAFAPEHDSLPADMIVVKEAASLAAVPAADSQEESTIPASNTLSAQSSRQPSVFLPQARPPQMITQPIGTAAKPVLAQLQPASSSNGKENVPMVEARQPSPRKEPDAAGAGSVGKGRQWWHHKSAFEMMAQSLSIGPSSQASLMESKLAELGGGPAHQTILALPPTPTSALPLVLRVCTADSEWESSGCSSVAKEALLMFTCAHPNVVPITILGLRAPVSPLTPQDPRHVAYFGMPLADISIKRRLGQEAWGKNGLVKLAYQGPSLLTLVKYAQAILKALAHTHSCRVLHRGLTPDHVLLFSRAGQEADGAVRRATKPAAIKHSVKLAGFGAAAKLSGQGVALHHSPYRCAEGYIPPEARQSSPLTTAADVYQLGGLCFFMAMGRHPPASLDPPPLPDYVPQEWRLVVSQCRATNPIDRPTVAQLQLHLLGLCCHIKQSPKSMKASVRSPALKPTQAAAHTQGLLPSVASRTTMPTTVIAASESDVMLPTMAVNPLYLPSTSPPHTPPADPKAASPARTHHAPVAVTASQAAMAAVRSQKALASAALGFRSALSMPKLMRGADQWLPEETVTFVEHSQGSTTPSHTAAERRQQSVADPDADTAAAGNERAAMHAFMAVDNSRVAAPSTSSLEATPATMDLGLRHSGSGSQAGGAEQQRLSGLTSEASEILQAVVSSHQAAAGPFGSFCEALEYATPSSGTAASGQQAGEVFSTRPSGSASFQHAKSSNSFCRTPSTAALIMSEEDGEDDSRHVQAADMGHFVSPSKYPVSQRLVGSPRLRLLPRREDSALEKPSVTGWMAHAQGKAAGFAASVGNRATEVAEQTSALLQHWSEGQQPTTNVPVSTAVTVRKHLLPHRSGRGSSAGLGSIVAHSFGVDDMCP